MYRLSTIIAAAIIVISMNACADGDPCDAQPNPDKQSVCKNEEK
jgi:hypothetical protein